MLPYKKLYEMFIARMKTPIRKITVNLPSELLDSAQQLTGKGITGAIEEGLRELQRKYLRSELLKLRGKVDFKLDLNQTRR
jgi:hypothetical protein